MISEIDANVLFLQFCCYHFIINFVISAKDFFLSGKIVGAEGHLHEEFLSDLTHTLEVWMDVVFSDGWHLSRWITDHLPCVDDVVLWDVGQRGNLLNS